MADGVTLGNNRPTHWRTIFKLEERHMEVKVLYKDKLHLLIGDVGKVWRELKKE